MEYRLIFSLITIGQLPIKSKVTQGMINEPIGVMLVGPPGY